MPYDFAESQLPPQQSEFIRGLRKVMLNRTAVFGGIILCIFIFVAIFGSLFTPHDPNKQSLKLRLAPPIGLGLEKASSDYPLGNDNLGRDILSRLIAGSRISLLIGITVDLLATLLGSIIGAFAGFFRGAFDNISMRIVDIWMAFPSMLLAIAFGAALGQGLQNLILALVLTNWVIYCRVVRSQVLVIREQDYVLATRALGGSSIRMVISHVLPNVLSSILVIATQQLGVIIITEASLSYLGISVQTSIPTWGGMLSDGKAFMREAWWMSTIPGFLISLVVLGANLLGDGLRDALDPRL